MLSPHNLVFLFPLGVTLWIGLRIGEGRQDERHIGILRDAMYIASATMIFMSLLGAVIKTSWISYAWLAVLAAAYVVLKIRNGKCKRQLLLQSLMMVDSDSDRLALAKNFVKMNRGSLRRLSLHLIQGVEHGTSWAIAAEKLGIASSNLEKLTLRTRDWKWDATNRLPDMIDPSRIQREVDSVVIRLQLALTLLLVILILVLLVMTFMFSTYAEMSDDVYLPQGIWATWQLQRFSILGRLSVLAFFLLCAVLPQISVFLWLFPSLIQRTPLRYLFHDYYRALGFIAWDYCMSRSDDLVEACKNTARVTPVNYVANRFEALAEKLKQGLPLGKSLEATRLARTNESALLSAADCPDSLRWAVRQFVLARVNATIRRLSMFVQLAVILLGLISASLVGFVGYITFRFFQEFIFFQI